MNPLIRLLAAVLRGIIYLADRIAERIPADLLLTPTPSRTGQITVPAEAAIPAAEALIAWRLFGPEPGTWVRGRSPLLQGCRGIVTRTRTNAETGHLMAEVQWAWKVDQLLQADEEGQVPAEVRVIDLEPADGRFPGYGGQAVRSGAPPPAPMTPTARQRPENRHQPRRGIIGHPIHARRISRGN